MPPRWNENRLTAKLGIDYPVIQGPLGGLSSQKLTAAVSNFGGLGSFAAHSLTPGAVKEVIAEIRSLTSKPFAMNLWVSFLTSLVEEVCEIAGPIIQWSAARCEKQILK
jgi:nitronate monooxygenase